VRARAGRRRASKAAACKLCASILLPVGSPALNVVERSIFPGTGLFCHLIAGITFVNPEFSEPRTAAKYVGRSTSTSNQGTTPQRSRLSEPSNSWLPSSWLN